MKIGLPKGDNYKLVLGSLQPCQRAFIECLTTCTEDELSVHLRVFTQWVWEKSDIICWGPVLNRFDDIFHRYIVSFRNYFKGGGISHSLFDKRQIELVISALKVSIMIVENCTSKSIYNSLELLLSLLDDVNPHIVFFSTRLLCVYFSSRNRRNAMVKEVPEVIARLSVLAQNPLQDKTIRIHSSTETSLTRKVVNVGEDDESVDMSYPEVLEHYLGGKRYLPTLGSYVEIGRDLSNSSSSDTSNGVLRIPIYDVINTHEGCGLYDPMSAPNMDDYVTILSNWISKNDDEYCVYQHILKTLKFLIEKYNIDEYCYMELKYKVCKIHSYLFPFMQRKIVDIRFSSLICMLLMSSASYIQFLGCNPSFILELTYFIKCHTRLDRTTMVVATELLSAMIYDGIQYKALANLLGFNMPHGTFIKVLMSYLCHPHQLEPLPPVLKLNTTEETTESTSSHENLLKNMDFHENRIDENQLSMMQLKGMVADGERLLKEWDWYSRLSAERQGLEIVQEEDSMRILLQLLIVYYSIISYHGSNNILTNISVLEAIVGFIRIRDPIYIPVVIYVVQVLEALLDYNQSVSRCLRNDLQLFHVFVSRLQYDMYHIQNFVNFGNRDTLVNYWPSGWKLPNTIDEVTLRAYWLSLSEISARKFLFKTIIKDLDSAARSYTGRNEIHEQDVFAPNSLIIPIIHAIFKDPATYGLGIYTSAITLISDTLGEDPISQEELHKLGIIPAFLNSICDENLKSEDCLGIIPTAICDIFSHRSGQEYMKNKKYKPLLQLIDIVVKREFVLFDRFGEVAASIGMTLDSIARNHEFSHRFIMKRIVSVMYFLLQEALTFPAFVPLDSKKCAKDSEMYLHELNTKPTAITLETLSSLDNCENHEFYADRIANLGKFLSTFLSAGQTISHFISCDGVKLIVRLCTVPCLPSMFLMIYPQHPLVLVLKYIMAHAADPCISYLHAIYRPYLTWSIGYKNPKSEADFNENVDYLRMFHGITHLFYLIHKENVNFYRTGCCGQYQTESQNLPTCEVHLAISMYLKRITTEFPFLMMQFILSTNGSDAEAIISGSHNAHEHSQLKAFKLYTSSTKAPSNQNDPTFSANDLFWSSQCAYSYTIPNPAYKKSQSEELSDDKYAMNLEMCRMTLVAIKALIFSLNMSMSKVIRSLGSENVCLKLYVANHSLLLSAVSLNLLKVVPSLGTREENASVFIDGMDPIKTAHYVGEAVEFIYKIYIDEHSATGFFILSFCVFSKLGGIEEFVRIFCYIKSLFLACALATALKVNPTLTADDVLGNNFHGNSHLIENIKVMAKDMISFDLKCIRSSMTILAKAAQICLNFFGKICNPKTVLSTQTGAEISKFLLSPYFKPHFSNEEIKMDSFFMDIVTTIGNACWTWLKLLAQIQSIAPSNSCASIHFFISPKLLGSLLKVHTYVLDYFSLPRQKTLKAHFEMIKDSENDKMIERGGAVSGNRLQPYVGASSRRNRRHRNQGLVSVSGDADEYESNDALGFHNTETIRARLVEMGFSERDISNAIAHCGYSDVTTLAEWLISAGEFDTGAIEEDLGHADLPCASVEQDSVELEREQETLDFIKQSTLFSVDCNSILADVDIWNISFGGQLRQHEFRGDVNPQKLDDDIRSNILQSLLTLARKMSTSLVVIFEFLLRILSLRVNLDLCNVQVDWMDTEDAHEGNVISLLSYIYSEIGTTYRRLRELEIDYSVEDVHSLLFPVIFVDEIEKQIAMETALRTGRVKPFDGYNCTLVCHHEYLLSLFYILAHLLGGREKYSSFVFKLNINDPIEDILVVIEYFMQKLSDANACNAIKYSEVVINAKLPGIPIGFPEWCTVGQFDKVGVKHNKLSLNHKLNYGIIDYGFYRSSPIPQIVCPPPFFKYAFICLGELLQKYSLFDLSAHLNSRCTAIVGTEKSIEITDELNKLRIIPKIRQQRLVNLSLSLLEFFPGMDEDLTFSILSILDLLTKIHSNVSEFLQYQRAHVSPAKLPRMDQKFCFSKSEGYGALSILLTIPRSGRCKGMLKLISNILLHCVEEPHVLKEVIRKRLIDILSKDSLGSMPLDKFIEAMHKFAKRDPSLLLDVLKCHCVITLEDGSNHTELKNLYITLRSSPKITQLLQEQDMMDALATRDKFCDLSETVNAETPISLGASNKRVLNLLRTIVDYMQIFCNIHGLTRMSGFAKKESKPIYPFSLTVNSLIYLTGSLYYNFPTCIKRGTTQKLGMDIPYKAFPWGFDDIWTYDAGTLLIYVIRRIFLMICGLIAPQNICPSGNPSEMNKDSQQDFEALQNLITSSLENYSNFIVLASSSSVEICIMVIEEINTLLQFFLGLNMKECGVHLFPTAIYTICNLLRHLLQIRFLEHQLKVSPAVICQIRKALTALLHKLNLYSDGSNVICSEIIRVMVLLTTPAKPQTNYLKDEVSSDSELPPTVVVEVTNNDGPMCMNEDQMQVSLDEDILLDDVDNDGVEEDISESDTEDGDLSCEEINEDMLDAEEDDDMSGETDSQLLSDTTDDEDNMDEDTSDNTEGDDNDAGDLVDVNDVEMALPHQVDDDYSADHSNSDSSSSLDEVEDGDDEDDAPRIRVMGEIGENVHEETNPEVGNGVRSHLNISDGDNEDDSDYSLSSSNVDTAEVADTTLMVSSAPQVNPEFSNDNLSFNLNERSTSISIPGEQNRTIHIEIQFGNNHGTLRYLDDHSSNRINPNAQSAERCGNDEALVNVATMKKGDTWSLPGDLAVPAKHPLLPPTRKNYGIKADENSEIMNLIALNLLKIQIPKNIGSDVIDLSNEGNVETIDENLETKDDLKDIEHDISVDCEGTTENLNEDGNMVVVEGNEQMLVDQSTTSYENRDLEMIAEALGISYTDLFALASMDPSVIAELPYDIRDEVILQQLNTINVDAVVAIRENRATNQTARVSNSENPAAPLRQSRSMRSGMQYLEALPRSLRLDAVRAIYGEGSSEANEINAALDLDGDDSSFIAALAPALGHEIFHGATQEFLETLTADLLNDTTGNRNDGITTRTRANARLARESSNGASAIPMMSDSILPNFSVSGASELGNATALEITSTDNYQHPSGLTLGFIIGEIRDGNHMRHRLSNNQRSRATMNNMRLVSTLGHRNRRGNLNSRGMNLNNIIFVDNRGIRLSRSTNGGLDRLGSASLNGPGRLDGSMGGSENLNFRIDSSRQTGNGFDTRILQSIPQLLNTFQPQLLNFIQPNSRGFNTQTIFPQSSGSQRSTDLQTPLDSNSEVAYDNLIENITSLFPKSTYEFKTPCHDNSDLKINILDNCGLTKCDFSALDLVAICKMVFLKTEINKKIFFKLLYNIAASGGTTCDLLLKLFLYIINLAILSLNQESRIIYRGDRYFSECPKMCDFSNVGFPPRYLYGSLPYKHVSLDHSLDKDFKGHFNVSNAFLSCFSPGNNHFSCVDLNTHSSGYVSSERVLEQLRSILIASPSTMDFFSRPLYSEYTEEMVETQEFKRKKKRIADVEQSSVDSVIYPINLLFMATSTNLFQSSTKHMNHLLMVIHNLIVIPEHFNTRDSADKSSDAVESSNTDGFVAAQSITADTDPFVPISDGISRSSFLNTDACSSYGDKNMVEFSKDPAKFRSVQQKILTLIENESVAEFLTVYCNWRYQSNWIQFCDNNKDGSVQNQMQIVAQIFSALYKSNQHSEFLANSLKNQALQLITPISKRLSELKSKVYKNNEFEHMISAFVRLIYLVNEMFFNAFKNANDPNEEMEREDSVHLKMTSEFYRKLPLHILWCSLDAALSCLSTSTTIANNSTADSSLLTASESTKTDMIMEGLTVLEPLIESFLFILQTEIALEYKLKNVSQLDQALSLVNFDIEIPKNGLDFMLKGTRATETTKRRENHDLDLNTEICQSHSALICFAEKHKRLISILVKQNPLILSGGFQPLVKLAPACLSFDIKRQYFRQKLKEKRQGLRLETIRINVRREHIFLDSYHQLRLKTGDEMKGKLSVSFGGEEGVDAGGLTREWFSILAKEMFNPNYGLFRREGRKQEFNHPNPLSAINPDHLNFFKFIGRVIGKAVYDGHHLDAYFCRSFYKHMLGRKITPADAESVDPQFFGNLMSINNCSLEELGLELYFSTEIDEFGKVKIIDLIPNGRNIPVTDENKHKYIELLCQHKVTNGIKEQLDAFMSGFRELICPKLVSIFDDRELELLISGIPIIDLENMRQNVEYVNYSESSDQIIWLWEFLEELDQNDLAAFLQFVTGTSRVPIGGFKNLMGMRGPQKISIHKTYGDSRLPTAHTCFNQLDLPAYPSKQLLKDKILQAILEGKEGFGFI